MASKIPVAFPDLDSIAAELIRLREAVLNLPRLHRKDVLARFGWSPATLYRKIVKEDFPRPVRRLWRAADLDAWEDRTSSTDSDNGDPGQCLA